MLLSTYAQFVLLLAVFIAVALCAVSVSQARSAKRFANKCYVTLDKYRKQVEPRREVARLAAEVAEMADAHAALMKSHSKLRSRIGMRENRERKRDAASSEVVTEGLSSTDKTQLRLAAKAQNLL